MLPHVFRHAAVALLLSLPSLAQTAAGPAPALNEAAAPATPAVPPVPAPPVTPAPAEAAKPKAKDPLEAFRQTQFSRTASATLDLMGAAEAAPPPAKPDAPAPEPVDLALKTLRRDIALGKWDSLGAFFKTWFADKPDNAKQAYLHLLNTLAQGGGGRPVPGGDADAQAQMQMQMQNQGNIPPGFMDTNVLSPADVLGLAAQSPADPEPEVLTKLGALLRSAVNRGNLVDSFLASLEKGTGKIGGPDPAARLRAARLLVAAGLPVEAAPFLAKPEDALAAKDAAALNLLALAAAGRHGSSGKPEDLETSWKLTQDALSVAEAGGEERKTALRRAVETAPKVRKELGAAWLAGSFTSKPELGMEILSGIGRATADSRRGFDSAPREANLELQSRAVQALLKAAPARAAEWSQPLTLLALNWMAEAKFSQERDTSSTRGPQMQYDPFGNVYFGSDMMMEQQMNMRGNQPRPVTAGRMLDLAPGTDWIAAVEPSLQPAILKQLAELHLKVKAEQDAFPFIETLAKTNPAEARELAERFIEVWGENHDPNADKRRTNRYMYIYGYNPQAEGIPLTRSRQARNLEDLAQWVQKLRALPGVAVDEAKIAQAFLRTHSPAEVYRMKDVEMVFGKLGDLKAATLAGVLGSMRQNLAGLWRSPKVQQEKKTKRTDKEIVAEVLRGYEVADYVTTPARKKYPADWRLRMIEASLHADENNYRNEQAKSGDFAAKRMASFAEFADAAKLYAAALPSMELKDQSADVYAAWFYAALGAPDLEGVKPEHVLAQGQIPLIREAIAALPGEAATRHATLFANVLSTRMTAAAPAVKHAYLSAGIDIAGTNERARPARDLLNYYKDLITEIQLEVLIDGADTVGTGLFGVFVNIRHTRQIEREAGGFQKYLQNQNNQPGFYNFGRPLENYRDKFEETTREALKESFEVVSVTFHPDKTESRGDGEEDWRVTPYCYLLLKAKGPQTDAFPPLKLSLDFIDTSGYAVLPVVSPKIPLDAGHTGPRPAERLEVRQILDERKAQEGVLTLEVKATARGLVPPLDQLLDLKPDGFVIDKIDDQDARVTQVEAANETLDTETAVSERLWNVTMHRDPAGEGAVKPSFTFAAPKSPEIKTTYYRYADADLKEVPQTVSLDAKYEKPGNPWFTGIGIAALLGVTGGFIWYVRRGKPLAVTHAGGFQMPEEITPLSVIGLLRRIRQSGRVQGDSRRELDTALQKVESHYYAPASSPESPDLASTAREWLGRATTP